MSCYMKMSDDSSAREEGENIDGVKNPFSVSRYPTVTDSLNVIFGLLGDDHRRYLLYYLRGMDGAVAEFEAAVNAVYKYEAAGADTDDHASWEEIRIELHHTHLPRLADAEIVDYDPRHGTIRFTGHPALEEWVDHARYKELD